MRQNLHKFCLNPIALNWIAMESLYILHCPIYWTLKVNVVHCNVLQAFCGLYHALPCTAMRCHAMQCNAMQCNGVPCSEVQGNAV